MEHGAAGGTIAPIVANGFTYVQTAGEIRAYSGGKRRDRMLGDSTTSLSPPLDRGECKLEVAVGGEQRVVQRRQAAN